MPLPHLTPDRQCEATSRRSGLRCQNFKCWGCRTCKYHGARKPETIRRGADHPQYRHGMETLEAKVARHHAIARLHELCDLGNKLGLFHDLVKLRGRRPKLQITERIIR